MVRGDLGAGVGLILVGIERVRARGTGIGCVSIVCVAVSNKFYPETSVFPRELESQDFVIVMQSRDYLFIFSSALPYIGGEIVREAV